jgi:hypothetical protein
MQAQQTRKRPRVAAPAEPDGILVASSGSPVSLFRCLWPFAVLLDNVQERVGASHLAYLDVLSIRNLPHFALGLL